MNYEDALVRIKDDSFCDSVKSSNLGADLALLKSEVIPALMSQINNLEKALQRDSEKIFTFKNSRDEL